MIRAVIFIAVAVSFAVARDGACDNQNDRDAIFTDEAAWDTKLSACATKCFADTKCTAECIALDAGVSDGCALCFGEVSNCGASQCFLPCALNPNGEACRQCVEQNCNPALLECSGLDRVPRVAPPSVLDYVDDDDLLNLAKLLKYGLF